MLPARQHGRKVVLIWHSPVMARDRKTQECSVALVGDQGTGRLMIDRASDVRLAVSDANSVLKGLPVFSGVVPKAGEPSPSWCESGGEALRQFGCLFQMVLKQLPLIKGSTNEAVSVARHACTVHEEFTTRIKDSMDGIIPPPVEWPAPV